MLSVRFNYGTRNTKDSKIYEFLANFFTGFQREILITLRYFGLILVKLCSMLETEDKENNDEKNLHRMFAAYSKTYKREIRQEIKCKHSPPFHHDMKP